MAKTSRTSAETATAAPPNRVGWQGRERNDAVARHRWQRDWTTQSADRHVARQRWRRARIAGLLSLSLGLFALLLYYLLYAPAQTPVLAITATNYPWPWLPNAWAQEDREGLAALDRQTIQLVDSSAAWESPQRGLAQLEKQLQAIKEHPPRTGTVVLLISMHGVVDAGGQPCLVPPGASPLNADTWLPLETLLAKIKALQLPDELHKLLILDCNRQQTNWHVGLLWNTFADGLPAAVAEANIPNLAILNSTSPGEAALAGDLQGSLFGRYLRLGLAGAADGEKGNGNGRVSLHELERYLQEHVDGWARRYRGQSQRPQITPAGAADFDVVWSERRGAWQGLVAAAERTERASPAVSLNDFTTLWSSHDRFANGDPVRFDPLAWRELEHRLLRLEQLARAGKAYADAAVTERDELLGQCTEIQRRIDAAANSSALPVQAEIFAAARAEQAPLTKMHSLPLAKFFGTLEPDKVRRATDQLSSLEEAPTAAQLKQSLRELTAVGVTAELSEVSFLTFLDRYNAPQLWREANVLAGAVQTHRRAEQLAAPPALDNLPGDERAHAWVRSQLAAADGSRRRAVDRFFLGEEVGETSAEADSLWVTAQSEYDAAEQQYREVASALKLRDRVWAETPYLAQWATQPQSEAAARIAADDLIRQTLLPLVEGTQRLGEQFWREEAAENAETGWQSDGTPATVQQQFTALRAAFDDRAMKLSTTLQMEPKTIVEIESLLATPLLSWPRREALERKRFEIADELQKAKLPAATATAQTEPEKPAGAATDELERLETAWNKHPLLAILSRIPAPPAVASEVSTKQEVAPGDRLRRQNAQRGETVRQQLASLAIQDIVYGRTPAPEVAGKKRLNRSDAALRLRDCCRGEALVRSAAAIHFDPPPEDPVARLRQFDLQELLLWHCGRALDDFWGPTGVRSQPWFANAARDYLAAVKSLGPANAEMQAQVDSLATRLEQRRSAASDAITLSAADILLIGQSTGMTTQVELKTNSPAAVAALPAGEAVAYLSDSQGRLPGAARPLPFTSLTAEGAAPVQKWEFPLDAEALKDRGPLLQAVAMFRGNSFSAPLLLRGTGGTKVDFEPYVYGPPRVTLSGYRRKRSSVVFILDCSHSMKATIEVEAPSAETSARTTRLEVAKNALRNLLSQLAERDDARVGVRFYGHRVGWSTAEQNKLLRQNRYIREIDPQLQPYADVEAVLPLGRFDSVAAGKVYDVMASIEPWGESPLYLALTQALQDFTAEDNDTERSIVVITDGVNYQYNPASSFARTKDDVLTAWRDSRVPIHIVGFGISQADAETARREYEDITSRTGGEFFSATNATAVIRSLQSLLKPTLYSVRDAADNKLDEAAVDSTVTVTPAPDTPRKYTVSFEGIRESIELAGGEAVELVVSRDASRLESLPYRKGVVQQGPLLGAAQESLGLTLFAQRPIRSTEGVRFPLALQYEAGRFTPRPAEVWIEILPRLATGQPAAPYHFYDVNYQPDRPVPVLEWLAESWPADARQAEIRFWCKPANTAVTSEVILSSVANLPPPSGDGFEVEAVPGMSYQARLLPGVDGPGSLQVAIVERHAADSPGVGSLKVELDSPPQRIVRQFDAENRLALHTFYYTGLDDAAADRLRIQFTTREKLQSQAWHLEEPLLVDVSAQADLLQLSPAGK